jgi:catechol 2,3-dioxygenase-like lactoylglutathione lyase family enzyme
MRCRSLALALYTLTLILHIGDARFMDSPIEKLTTVTVVVKDQGAALDFYTKTLGFEKKTDVAGNVRWLTVAPKGQDIEILLWQAGSTTEGMPPSLSHAGDGTGLHFQVKDCRKAYEELKARGVKFKSEPSDNPWSTVAEFTDPDGNPFRLTQMKAMSASDWKK